LEPAPRATSQLRANGTVSHTQSQQIEDPTNRESEEFDETREKLQMIRVKFLRLAHRLGQTPHNIVVAQVLYRLGLAEQLRGRNGGRVAGFDRTSAMAEHLEATGRNPLISLVQLWFFERQVLVKVPLSSSLLQFPRAGKAEFPKPKVRETKTQLSQP